MSEPEELGAHLRSMRQRLGLSLADFYGPVGMCVSDASKFERGLLSLSSARETRLLEALELSRPYLGEEASE